MMPYIVLGAGGHAKVLVDILQEMGQEILAICDTDFLKEGTRLLGVSVYGSEEFVLRQKPERIFLVNGLGSIGNGKDRTDLFLRFKQQGYTFAKIVSPHACVSRNAEIDEGTCVFQGAIIQAGSRVGKNVIVNTRASIDHDCAIADHCHIAPGVTLSGNVTIGEGAHIGCGATIIQGIRVGKRSLVAAGSIVVRNVEEETIVMGIPARVTPKKAILSKIRGGNL